MAVAANRDTKTTILDAAQKLMAEHGINGVSLRAISAEADANAASLHYHFGSRDVLIEAILARHGRRNTEFRREIVAKKLARDTPAVIRDVVDALMDPLLRMLGEEVKSDQGTEIYVKELPDFKVDWFTVENENPDGSIPSSVTYYDNEDGYWDDYIKAKRERNGLPAMTRRPYFKH